MTTTQKGFVLRPGRACATAVAFGLVPVGYWLLEVSRSTAGPVLYAPGS